MAGTTLAAGVLAVAVSLSVGLAAVGGAAVTAQRAAGAADAAALAAADAVSGAIAVSDAPCDVAASVATAAGATLTHCAVVGLVATVQVKAAYAGLAAVSRARAGPPMGRDGGTRHFPARTQAATETNPSRWCVWCASKKGCSLG